METGRPNHGKVRNKSNPRHRSAFTLVELILVMAIMLMLVGLISPSLGGFFQGHHLDNEALRFLALTRFGQSRAVNEGVPVELWVNPTDRTYGLEALSGYTETDTKPQTYTLDSSIQITFSAPSSVMLRSNYWSQVKGQLGAVTRIRFQPDGFISDASPANIYLRQGNVGKITITKAPTHMEYDIQTGQLNGR